MEYGPMIRAFVGGAILGALAILWAMHALGVMEADVRPVTIRPAIDLRVAPPAPRPTVPGPTPTPDRSGQSWS